MTMMTRKMIILVMMWMLMEMYPCLEMIPLRMSLLKALAVKKRAKRSSSSSASDALSLEQQEALALSMLDM